MGDPVALEEEREAAGVVLVGMRDHDRVEPPVPGRDPGVERDEEPTRVAGGIDEEASAASTFDKGFLNLRGILIGIGGRPARPRRPSRRTAPGGAGPSRGRSDPPVAGSPLAGSTWSGVATIAAGGPDGRSRRPLPS